MAAEMGGEQPAVKIVAAAIVRADDEAQLAAVVEILDRIGPHGASRGGQGQQRQEQRTQNWVLPPVFFASFGDCPGSARHGNAAPFTPKGGADSIHRQEFSGKTEIGSALGGPGMGCGKAFVVCAALLTSAPAVPAGADAVADFYRDRQVTLLIGYAPGGAYDSFARTVARHLTKHIPGNPVIVPRNMPGPAACWC